MELLLILLFQKTVNVTATTLVYVDGTQGWRVVTGRLQTTNQYIAATIYVTATGGTVTTCGNYKIHTFTGPGTFTVSSSR